MKYFRSVLMMFYTSAMNPKYETFKEQVLSYLEEPPFYLNYSMLEGMGHLPIVSIIKNTRGSLAKHCVALTKRTLYTSVFNTQRNSSRVLRTHLKRL